MLQRLIVFVTHYWALSSRSMFLMYWEARNWTEHSRFGLTSAVEKGTITFLILLAALLLMKPRTLNPVFRNSVLLAHVQPGVHHDPQVLYCKAAFHLSDEMNILQKPKYFLSKKTWLAYIISGENANSPLLSALSGSALLERKPCRCLWQQGRVPWRAVSGLCAIHSHENIINKNFSYWLIVTAFSYWARVSPGVFFAQ